MERGYLAGVRERLSETYQVVHNPGNGGDSANVLSHLDAWLAEARPDVIHFNCGLHDLKWNRSTRSHQVGIEAYRSSLAAIAERLRMQEQATLIFALTTPVNTAWHREKKPFDRRLSDVKLYNNVATQVMREYGIPVNDLYAVIREAGTDTCLVADGVHMNERGNALLAEAVTSKVREITTSR